MHQNPENPNQGSARIEGEKRRKKVEKYCNQKPILTRSGKKEERKNRFHPHHHQQHESTFFIPQ